VEVEHPLPLLLVLVLVLAWQMVWYKRNMILAMNYNV
jgi:hypothetical protein